MDTSVYESSSQDIGGHVSRQAFARVDLQMLALPFSQSGLVNRISLVARPMHAFIECAQVILQAYSQLLQCENRNIT